MAVVVTVVAVVSVGAGCDSLRFAPSEVEKQNCYLHQRTVEAAAVKAEAEQVSGDLQALTKAASQQSESMVAYFGLPREVPASGTIEEILSDDNVQITSDARASALERPSGWDLADHMLELGIAIAGLVGGVYGTKVLAALQLARQKSAALREIVQGNELFKRQDAATAQALKQAQSTQSATTRALVASLKQS